MLGNKSGKYLALPLKEFPQQEFCTIDKIRSSCNKMKQVEEMVN